MARLLQIRKRSVGSAVDVLYFLAILRIMARKKKNEVLYIQIFTNLFLCDTLYLQFLKEVFTMKISSNKTEVFNMRIDSETNDMLCEIADVFNVPKSVIVRRALHEYCWRILMPNENEKNGYVD